MMRSFFDIFRIMDFTLAAIGLAVTLPVLLLVTVIGFFDTGSPIFIQERMGRHQRLFRMIKFRTMRREAASVPTHLADVALITGFGRLLRKTKMDELPQLWNVLRGEMSLVGPRPCLPGQHELIRARALRNVFDARPGITGLAQVRGITMAEPVRLAETDQQMLLNLTPGRYFSLILATISGGDRSSCRE
jgi:lipopolysaccharide/colanic/teichoic acid biosynthesis glycosyltransferase